MIRTSPEVHMSPTIAGVTLPDKPPALTEEFVAGNEYSYLRGWFEQAVWAPEDDQPLVAAARYKTLAPEYIDENVYDPAMHVHSSTQELAQDQRIGKLVRYLGYKSVQQTRFGVEEVYTEIPSIPQINQKIRPVNEWLRNNEAGNPELKYYRVMELASYDGGLFPAEKMVENLATTPPKYLMANGSGPQERDSANQTPLGYAIHDLTLHAPWSLLLDVEFQDLASQGARESLAQEAAIQDGSARYRWLPSVVDRAVYLDDYCNRLGVGVGALPRSSFNSLFDNGFALRKLITTSEYSPAGNMPCKGFHGIRHQLKAINQAIDNITGGQ